MPPLKVLSPENVILPPFLSVESYLPPVTLTAPAPVSRMPTLKSSVASVTLKTSVPPAGISSESCVAA